MGVITRYIAKEVIKGSLISLLVLLTLFNLFTFSDELKDLGEGDYGLREIFYYLGLTSPRVLYELMPSSALLGSLFVLGAMANNRELIAMRASGLSVAGIIKSVMTAGAFLVAFSIIIGEFVAPVAERKAQLIKTTAQNKRVVLQSEYGIWLREGNKFINVRQMKDNGELADVSIYQLNEDDYHLDTVIHAEKGVFLGNEIWRLEDIKESEISRKQIFANKIKQQEWKTSVDPALLDVVVVKAENLSLYGLAMYIEFLKDNNQKAQAFELAFWSRLINPLVTFIMLLVSAPFVIGIKRGVSTGGRMMLGVLIGMSFNIADKIVGHMSLVYEINPAIMAMLPSLVMFVLAIVALRKVQFQ